MLLVLVISTPASVQRTLFTCTMDGQTRTSCCCEEHVHDAPSPTIGAQGCCEVTVIEGNALPVAEHSLPTRHELPATVALTSPPGVVAPLPPTSSYLVAPSGPRAPPEPRGSPIFIEVCSLLI